LENSSTTQGVVAGRGTGGSAVAVLREPRVSWAAAGVAARPRRRRVRACQ
jgi:hypothetical protein